MPSTPKSHQQVAGSKDTVVRTVIGWGVVQTTYSADIFDSLWHRQWIDRLSRSRLELELARHLIQVIIILLNW